MKISFLGDIMLHRSINDLIKNGTYDFFKNIKSVWSDSDLVVANLEAPFTNEGRRFERKDKHLSFSVDPYNIKVLKKAGIQAVTLANNHTTDYGRTGVMNTVKTLKENGFYYSGAGVNIKEAGKPLFYKKGDLRVGIIAANAFYPFSRFAENSRYGTLPFRSRIINNIIQDHDDQADFFIVTLHWGIDYKKYPVPALLNKARELLKMDKVLSVIGHHPHVVQPVIHDNGKIIACSLGNCLFDEPFKESREGLILTLDISNKGLENVDHHAFNFDDDFILNQLEGAEKESFYSDLDKLYEGIHNGVDEFKEMDSRWSRYLTYYAVRYFNPGSFVFLLSHMSFIKIISSLGEKILRKVKGNK